MTDAPSTSAGTHTGQDKHPRGVQEWQAVAASDLKPLRLHTPARLEYCLACLGLVYTYSLLQQEPEHHHTHHTHHTSPILRTTQHPRRHPSSCFAILLALPSNIIHHPHTGTHREQNVAEHGHKRCDGSSLASLPCFVVLAGSPIST